MLERILLAVDESEHARKAVPVAVELARAELADPALAEAIRERVRNVLVVQARIDLVPWGSLGRSEYKSKLVETKS